MYGYGELLRDAAYFEDKGVEVFTVGLSRQGRKILCFAHGSGAKPVVSTAAIHARENASAYAVLGQLEYALKNNVDYRQYFIPLANPDGAELLRRYYDNGEEKYRLWKANAVGVDLNVNFDANWGSGSQNVRTAGGENYIGANPFSEPETRALAVFTKKCGAAATLSYHTAGRELYWYFFQKTHYERDLAYAEFIEKYLRYKYKRIDSDMNSAGGYKDWCIQALNIPAFTVELGYGTHPLGKDDLTEDIELNKGLASALSERLTQS